MTLWRISRHRDLAGAGGLRAPGRWHNAGCPVVYLADSPAAALLEVCVHTAASDIPPEFTLLKIQCPGLKPAAVRLSDLPPDWHSRPEVTRDLGSLWLERGTSALLAVPSALVPETFNYLFNPRHAAAPKFQVVAAFACPLDPRIKL